MNLLWSIFNLAFACLIWPWLAAYIAYIFAARGTKLRFVLRTFMRPVNPFMVTAFAIKAVEYAIEQNWLLVFVDLYNIWWISKFTREFNNDDEDDMWKRLKKKLRSFASSVARKAREVLVPAPTPVPVRIGSW